MSAEGLKTVFDWMAVILLFLTFASGLGVLVTGNMVNSRQAKQLRKFDKDLTDAKLSLGQQQERTAKADALVASLAKDAADAKAAQGRVETELAKQKESTASAEKAASDAALALEKFKAPRILSRLQQAKIAVHLRPFGSQRVDLIVIGDAPEIVGIAQSIVDALAQAGWTINFAAKAVSGPNVSGVLVGTHLGSDEPVNNAANALISALQAEEIISHRLPQFGDELPMALLGAWDQKKIAPIRILVSQKP